MQSKLKRQLHRVLKRETLEAFSLKNINERTKSKWEEMILYPKPYEVRITKAKIIWNVSKVVRNVMISLHNS